MAQETISSAGNVLEQLKGSKYEIVPSQPDISGWWVTDPAGSKIGNIDDLIFDPASWKVCYLLVNIADNDYGLQSKCVLLPVEAAEFQETEALVVVHGVAQEIIRKLPDYHKQLLNKGICEESSRVFTSFPNHQDQDTTFNGGLNERSGNPGLETFKDGELIIKIYKEVPVVIEEAEVVEEVEIRRSELSDNTKYMKDKEPFEIYIDGEMLTVIPVDGTYMVYKGMSKLGDIMPHEDGSGIVWVTGDLIPLEYLAQIGEQIEQSDAWNQIKSE